MTDAPETIWAKQTSGWGGLVRGSYQNTPGAHARTEYTRTDISQARIAELEARNGKLGDAVAYATQKFTHQELRIAQLEAELKGWQDQFKAQFPDTIDALKAKP